MFGGIDYQIDLSQPPGKCIVHIMYQNRSLADTDRLQLAVNNYRYSDEPYLQRSIITGLLLV
nr:hypothetical protein [Paenibacillus sp. Root52]